MPPFASFFLYILYRRKRVNKRGTKNFSREVGPVSLVGWIVIGLIGFNVLFIIFLRLIIWLEDRRERK